jgi:hypothetical protein
MTTISLSVGYSLSPWDRLSAASITPAPTLPPIDQVAAIAAHEALAAHNRLIRRAVTIAKAPPYGRWIHEIVSLEIHGDNAVLHWSEHDEDGAEAIDIMFPLALLCCSDADLAAWQAAHQKIADEVRAGYDAAQRERAEASERARYAALKAKYG